MQITNTVTGQDVSDLFLKLMKKEITNAEFEELAGIPEEDRKANI